MSVTGVPPEEAEEPYEVMGLSVMVTWLFQHPASGEMYINMLTCTLSIVDQGLNPMADDHPTLALQDLSDLGQITCFNIQYPLACSYTSQFIYLACLP